jgi:hypothetical protein
MIEIPVTFNSDEKGYFDRECPNENCLYTFKINMEDWKEKVSAESVHCPLCGHVNTSDKWWTQAQLDAMHQLAVDRAMSYIQSELDKSFKDLEHSTHNNKFCKITYKPGPRVTFINNPLGQCEEWEQEIQCPNCQTRYSVIGSAFFCPCCGCNVIEDVFDESLDTVIKMVDSLPEMEEMLTKSYGKDKAVSMCRSMLEGSLGDVVSAFQKFAEMKYKSVSGKDAKVNDFQIVEKGSRLFKEACGKGYDCWLSADELVNMNLMFQRRHIYEHNGGIVDEKYVEKSGDSSYKVGQRLVIHNREVKGFITIIKKLTKGLLQLQGVGQNET